MYKIICLLFLSSIAFAYEPPYQINNIQDGKERFMKYAISENDKDEYRLLGNMVDKTSTQSISGNKTFTGTTTFSSATITNLTATNPIVANGGITLPSSGAGLNPVGTIITYISSSSIPTGYLYCNGQAVSTTTYSALFAVIGYKFGGSTTMNLPDMRGMFLRGLDNGRGYDTDSNRVVGSTQTDTFQGHWHQGYGGLYNITPGGSAYRTMDANNSDNGHANAKQAVTDGTNGTPRTGPETRPENIAVTYIIKY